MRTKKGRQEYFSILFEKLEWWHGDSWPIILAFRGNRPLYRTQRNDTADVAPDHVVSTTRLTTVEQDDEEFISAADAAESRQDDARRDFHHLKTGS
ncbi:MAG: hypothetical protein PF508_13025 [Spirochaeta sp.]|nr:hypothetical protein [Spirochaeta sp.]